MKKEVKKEWLALCQTCKWNGKRCPEQAASKQEVENHLKKYPEHKVRVLVTGGGTQSKVVMIDYKEDYKGHEIQLTKTGKGWKYQIPNILGYRPPMLYSKKETTLDDPSR